MKIPRWPRTTVGTKHGSKQESQSTTVDDAGSSLARIGCHREPNYGLAGGVVPDPLGDFFRSLVRVPPHNSYSLLSGPYCASTAESIRLFSSRKVFFVCLQIVLQIVQRRNRSVIGIQFLREGRG
jgi:hypothetical protein